MRADLALVLGGALATGLVATSGRAGWTAATAITALLMSLWVRGRRVVPAAAAPAPVRPWQDDALQAALAALREGVVVLDSRLQVLATNQPAQMVLGIGGEADRTRPLPELVDWPQLAVALRAAGNGAARWFEAERQVGDETRLFAITAAAAAQGRMIVLVLHDLSRLRQLESHRRDFVANVSHELKTPLAAIKGFVETLLADGEVPPMVRQRFLQRIGVQVDRLATLVADLLTLSRLDDQPAVVAVEPYDFIVVVREAVRDLRPLAERKGIRVEAQIASGPVWIAAEREALRQIVGNLVDNAIKYTPANGTVIVRTELRGQRAELEVLDTGIGLSAADQQRVFERFYRVDRARSRELGGTGLGLSIVKNTVRLLGGEVGVRSQLGHGSAFWVWLPVSEPPSAA